MKFKWSKNYLLSVIFMVLSLESESLFLQFLERSLTAIDLRDWKVMITSETSPHIALIWYFLDDLFRVDQVLLAGCLLQHGQSIVSLHRIENITIDKTTRRMHIVLLYQLMISVTICVLMTGQNTRRVNCIVVLSLGYRVLIVYGAIVLVWQIDLHALIADMSYHILLALILIIFILILLVGFVSIICALVLIFLDILDSIRHIGCQHINRYTLERHSFVMLWYVIFF